MTQLPRRSYVRAFVGGMGAGAGGITAAAVIAGAVLWLAAQVRVTPQVLNGNANRGPGSCYD
jgi:type IV secretory pathway TrbF-like protein